MLVDYFRYQTSTTARILNTIVSIQPKESAASGGETREQLVTRLVLAMQETLPSAYDPYHVIDR